MALRHRLLDLTRLASRVGRGPLTGIDRVEATYLDRFLADPEPASFVVMSRRRTLILSKPAATAFRERLAGRAPWGRPDMIALLSRRKTYLRLLAEASLWREADHRVRPTRIASVVPEGSDYYNVGHSNLGAAFLDALGAAPDLRRTVLIHDTIPLDHPAFTRPDMVASFQSRLQAVSAHADRVIHISQQTRDAAERRFKAAGRVPPGLVVPIGVSISAPDAGALPPGLPPDGPYFVALGTIEPRKNHALLLDLWDEFHATLPEAEIPHLVIAGSRGWLNEEVFARLDTVAAKGRIHEHRNLSDGAVAALLKGAAGLLFPSLAEGFGLPPLEAAALGVPVVAAPLPVYRETLGGLPVYAAPYDRYLWAQIIRRLAEERVTAGKTAALRPAFAPPDWDSHFKAVLTMP